MPKNITPPVETAESPAAIPSNGADPLAVVEAIVSETVKESPAVQFCANIYPEEPLPEEFVQQIRALETML